MMEYCCSDCGTLLTIHSSLTIASHTMIKIEPCSNCDDNRCIKDTCDKFSELKDNHAMEIKQLQEDVSVLDKIIENVKKATEGDE